MHSGDLADNGAIEVFLGRTHRLVGHGVAKLLKPLEMPHGLFRFQGFCAGRVSTPTGAKAAPARSRMRENTATV